MANGPAYNDKVLGYLEGILHGYAVAQKRVEDLSGGLFTLAEPREITETRAALKRAQAERRKPRRPLTSPPQWNGDAGGGS